MGKRKNDETVRKIGKIIFFTGSIIAIHAVTFIFSERILQLNLSEEIINTYDDILWVNVAIAMIGMAIGIKDKIDKFLFYSQTIGLIAITIIFLVLGGSTGISVILASQNQQKIDSLIQIAVIVFIYCLIIWIYTQFKPIFSQIDKIEKNR